MALQMTWVNAYRRKSPPLGLRNLGNSCYLNSVLQCLTYTPPLANFCLSNRHSSICELSNVCKKHECPFCLSLSIESPLDVPAKIQSSIQIFAKHFRIGRQEDAHEFLRYMMDACHNTCLKLLKSRNGVVCQNGQANGKTEKVEPNTIVKEIFGGVLQSQVKCLSCDFESNKMDDIMDISLDLFQCRSLKEALQRFFQPEILDGSNKYSCEKCNKLSAARKQMSIFQAPNVLVIQLKRFEGVHGLKIDRPITFGEDLALAAYMCKQAQDPQPEYSLFGSIVHAGYSPESGHYYAYVKDASGQWYCCNDAHVTLATVEEVLSEKVYILFFVRTNQRPKFVKSLSSNGSGIIFCNGKGDSVVEKAKHLHKQSAFVLTNGNYSTKCSPNSSTFEKEPPKAKVKFSIVQLAAPQSRRGDANGNTSPKIQEEASKGRLRKPEELLIQRQKQVSSTNSNGVGDADSSKKDNDSTTNKSFPDHACGTVTNKRPCINSNGLTMVGQCAKIECRKGQCDNNVSRACYLNTREVKRKVCDGDVANVSNSSNGGLHALSGQESGCKLSGMSSGKEHISIETKLKEKLCQDTLAFLRTCQWYDEVYSFMRDKKRLCLRDASIPRTDFKPLLISDAKATFNSQIPQALKVHLLERIESCMSGQK
ncbi:Ubiquitin carboxyl-terminal hydrolase 25 [Nymphaea thermarum]|nr:Ubiquitin carboxyl-terminal hydrolase 25 [Nymphaea thermarum]